MQGLQIHYDNCRVCSFKKQDVFENHKGKEMSEVEHFDGSSFDSNQGKTIVASRIRPVHNDIQRKVVAVMPSAIDCAISLTFY